MKHIELTQEVHIDDNGYTAPRIGTMTVFDGLELEQNGVRGVVRLVGRETVVCHGANFDTDVFRLVTPDTSIYGILKGKAHICSSIHITGHTVEPTQFLGSDGKYHEVNK